MNQYTVMDEQSHIDTPEFRAFVKVYEARLQQRLALIGVERHLERIGFPSLVGPQPARPARRSKGFG